MKHLSVLIGESEEVIIEIVTDTIQEVVGEDCALDVRSTWKFDELMRLAETVHIDLFVIYLNNILYQDKITSGDQRVRAAQQLVSTLKEKYPSPIITLGGFSEYSGKVEEAGAEYFFETPFKLNELRDAVESCLNL